MNSARIQDSIIALLLDKEKCSVHDMKNHLKNIDDGLFSEGQFSGSINTLLRKKTIKKVGRGIYTLIPRSENMRKCFVVSPIGSEGSDTRKRADQLFKYIILPVCEQCDFSPIRVDQINDSDSITQTILDHLKNDDLVIADISEHNPNAFFEMGYRTSLGKPMIHLKQSNEIIPFDIASIRTYDYDLSDLDSVDKIKSRLVKTINSITFGDDMLEPQETFTSTNVLPLLNEISYKLDDIENLIQKDNSSMIQSIIKACNEARPEPKQESMEDMMTRMVMEKLLSNPSSADSLIALADKFGHQNG